MEVTDEQFKPINLQLANEHIEVNRISKMSMFLKQKDISVADNCQNDEKCYMFLNTFPWEDVEEPTDTTKFSTTGAIAIGTSQKFLRYRGFFSLMKNKHKSLTTPLATSNNEKNVDQGCHKPEGTLFSELKVICSY
eukprot:jgi/Psemu1/19590/gm1.19590_g